MVGQMKNYKLMDDTEKTGNSASGFGFSFGFGRASKSSMKFSQDYVMCGWWGFASAASVHCAFTDNDILHTRCAVSLHAA